MFPIRSICRRATGTSATLSLAAVLTALLAGCGGHASVPPIPERAAPLGNRILTEPDAGAQGKISHVVIIIQENRSFDNIFHGFKGADYATSGKNSAGKTITLTPINFVESWDLCHNYVDAVTDIDGGAMDGFDHCPGPNHLKAYSYVQPNQTAKYFTLAKQYGMSDKFFSSAIDDSYIAHQYLIAGYAGMAQGHPDAAKWGCDAAPSTTIQIVDSHGKPTKKVYPCFEYNSLAKEFDAKGLSWRYYAPSTKEGAYIWSAYDALGYIRNGADWTTNVVSPQCQVLTDAAAGNLPAVTWVVPTLNDSDHPLTKKASGPAWVTAIVNAIGKSSLWNSTAIFILWDDWGGFYDHVVPPSVDFDGEGFRVPFIAVSPYSKVGGISHGPPNNKTGKYLYEFASILKSIEGLYGVNPMGAREKNTNIKSLWPDTALFDFTQTPRAFKPLSNAGYHCTGTDMAAPDTDFGGPDSQP